MDLALNNLQWLICHKTKPNKQTNIFFFTYAKERKKERKGKQKERKKEISLNHFREIESTKLLINAIKTPKD